jgi:hypothetical protein
LPFFFLVAAPPVGLMVVVAPPVGTGLGLVGPLGRVDVCVDVVLLVLVVVVLNVEGAAPAHT